jgi:tRNA(fMet)-specific endonuclease VapC
MPYVVVDTCVLSYIYDHHSLAEGYRAHIEGNTPVISFMTLAEVHYGTLKADWGESRRSRLLEYVARDYLLFPFNRALCRRWAMVRDQSRRDGRQVKVADSWIAATAMLHDIPLVTNNRSDFQVLEPELTLISES